MPIYLRKFYYKKLVDIKKEETEQVKKSQNKSIPTPTFQQRFNR